MEWRRVTNSVAGLSSPSLFVCSLALGLFGLLMIYSASAALGMQQHGDALFYVKKQAVFFLIGIGTYFFFAQLAVRRLCRYRLFFLLTSLLALVLVLIPGIGVEAGGAQRWLNLGFIRFQPSELVRLMLVFYLAGTLSLRTERLSSFNRGFLPLLIVSSVLMFLLILQPDFGSAMGIFAISLTMWFVGGLPISFLGGLLVLSLPAILFVLFQASYRLQRVMTFLDPWKDPQGAGFQVIQSFNAFYEGGWTGLGLGNGQQKLFYLPEAHTDFILSVVGEELGVVGVAVVTFFFMAILYLGSRIARQQKYSDGYLLAIGCAIFVSLPAMLNMMVTLGLLPTKGMPLPLVSYGGTSLIISMAALGILQSLHFRGKKE